MEQGERLEKFIRDNRKEFEEFEPPAYLWDKIEADLDEKEKNKPHKDKVVKLKFVIRFAAAIVLISTFGLLYLKYSIKGSVDVASIDPELAEQQSHYVSVIEYKQEKLIQIKDQEPQLYREFSSELEKLQVNYKKLQKDLKTSPNQEVTLKAMIRNLQAQSEVLNQQLTVIQQLKQLKLDQSNENKGI